MTQEEFKVISEVVKESKNIPNAKLEETMDKLTSEFEEQDKCDRCTKNSKCHDGKS